MSSVRLTVLLVVIMRIIYSLAPVTRGLCNMFIAFSSESASFACAQHLSNTELCKRHMKFCAVCPTL